MGMFCGKIVHTIHARHCSMLQIIYMTLRKRGREKCTRANGTVLKHYEVYNTCPSRKFAKRPLGLHSLVRDCTFIWQCVRHY